MSHAALLPWPPIAEMEWHSVRTGRQTGLHIQVQVSQHGDGEESTWNLRRTKKPLTTNSSCLILSKVAIMGNSTTSVLTIPKHTLLNKLKLNSPNQISRTSEMNDEENPALEDTLLFPLLLL